MKYGLIGEHLGHSYSKQIHGHIADYVYELCAFPPKELEGFIRRADFEGINVTIPYKKAVMPLLDEISPEAARIGSVNTVVCRGGKRYGYNTDYEGFARMAKQTGICFSNRKVLILGTGGTSVTAQAVALDEGAAEIVCVSRSGEVNYENVYRHSDAEILVNTTPVGMYPDNDGWIVRPERFANLRGVLDVIYNPLRTNLVLNAREMAVRSSGGLPMLVYQAIAAASLFTGEKMGEALGERVVREMQQNVQNIVLVGMPGCGKTTVGRLLAGKMGREFVDADACIEEQAGRSIPSIFEQQGEASFRAIEHAAIAETAKSAGIVIATGGGAVLDERNMRALKRNGRIYYLDRAIDTLSTDGRPLSSGKRALEAMYEVRHPLYLGCCDACIDGNGSAEHVAKAIEEDFYETAGD